MKTVISALIIKVEETTYNEAGQQIPRKPLIEVVAFESQIPPEVAEWVRGILRKAH
jgi:hypothetical protein